MNFKSNFRWLAFAIPLSIVTAGCAITPDTQLTAEPAEGADTSTGADTGAETFNRLVSRDVVSVFTQINELSPASTILGTSNDAWRSGDFANSLKNELESSGYAIRSVGAGPGTISMGYEITDNTSAVPAGWTGESRTVTVMAGSIAVRRSYLISTEGAISPLGKMQVRGADASTLTLQKDIFNQRANDTRTQDAKSVEPEPADTPAPEWLAQSTEPAADATEPPTSTYEALPAQRTDGQPDQAYPGVAGSSKNAPFLHLVAPTVATTEPSREALLAIKPDTGTANVMDLQQSNFEDLFADMAFVNEKVLTFPNDSIQMGEVNKVRLQVLVDNFEAESDVFSLVGCSLGQTNYSGGQEGLARGRATRVREELLYAGIPADRIVEEGCWAEEAFDARMPQRGVVVTLKRRLG